MTVTEITSIEAFAAAKDSADVVVVDFYANWCGPCRMMAPVLEEYSNLAELKGVKFFKLNIDELREINDAEEVEALPTFKIYSKGKALNAVVGASKEFLLESIRSAVAAVA